MDAPEVREYWAERDGAYSPEYYAYRGPDESSRIIARILTDVLDRSAPVLELGCSAGRHLAHLHDQGFDDLTGIDVNSDAAAVMEATYPDLAAAGEFYFAAMEDVLQGFADDRFAAVYSVETLQHVHPEAAWLFDEIARITGELLVTAEVEEGTESGVGSEQGVNFVDGEVPLYYRDWAEIFESRGFTQFEIDSTQRTTVRAFRPADCPG